MDRLKTFLKANIGWVLAFLLVVVMMGAITHSRPANAASVSINDMGSPIYVLKGYGDAGTYTNATTSYTDVTGMSVTFTPTRNDPTLAGSSPAVNQKADLIKVVWSLQASKATATTGSCGVYVNAALVTASVRSITTGTPEEVSGVLVIPNTVVGAQTVKLQCVSGDTNTFTVSAGHFVVEEVVRF